MSDTETKSADEHLQSTEKVFSASSDERILAFTPDEQRRIVRRVDLRLAVTLGLLYCVSLLDRTNLGSASIAGFASLTQTLLYCANLCYQNAKGTAHECRKQWVHHRVDRLFYLLYRTS